MESLLDSLGFLLVAGLIFGAPLVLVFYGLYVAITQGISAEGETQKRAEKREFEKPKKAA